MPQLADSFRLTMQVRPQNAGDAVYRPVDGAVTNAPVWRVHLS